jgi:hypothetical protein
MTVSGSAGGACRARTGHHKHQDGSENGQAMGQGASLTQLTRASAASDRADLDPVPDRGFRLSHGDHRV